MLGKIRKFSSSIFAKVFLLIIAVPFVFWGMGPVFQGGKLNTIAEIDNEKIATQDFINYLKYESSNLDNVILNENIIERRLYDFIRLKVISLEIDQLEIKISKNSLAQIIKNESAFQKDNKFSRVEYEKFLVKNQINPVSFESNLSKQLNKENFFDLIRGGIVPSNFLINKDYNKANQVRNIQLIDLNDVFVKNLNLSQTDIEIYFEKNKDKFSDIYKSFKFIKLNPKNLSGSNEFSDLFFQKIDEIDDLIVDGKNIDFIIDLYNLNNFSEATFNNKGKDINGLDLKRIPSEIALKNFDNSEAEPIVLLENKDDFYVLEFISTKKIEKKITNAEVKKTIQSSLKREALSKKISEIINRINNNNFKEDDFYKFSKEKNAIIKKVNINSIKDNKNLKGDIVQQIYKYPKNRVIIAADLGLSESYLIYIENVKDKVINLNDENYNEYFNLSKSRIANDIVNTYDSYLNKKYDININYKALERVKNSLK